MSVGDPDLCIKLVDEGRERLWQIGFGKSETSLSCTLPLLDSAYSPTQPKGTLRNICAPGRERTWSWVSTWHYLCHSDNIGTFVL